MNKWKGGWKGSLVCSASGLGNLDAKMVVTHKSRSKASKTNPTGTLALYFWPPGNVLITCCKGFLLYETDAEKS